MHHTALVFIPTLQEIFRRYGFEWIVSLYPESGAGCYNLRKNVLGRDGVFLQISFFLHNKTLILPKMHRWTLLKLLLFCFVQAGFNWHMVNADRGVLPK